MARNRLPPLNWLRAFEASARHLSFTGAAGELNMTQSAVSQQIKALENHLGRILFHRKTRALELTQSGHAYLPTIQEAFITLSRGTNALLGADSGQVLEIKSNLAFSVYWLTPRLTRLFEKFPWLSVNITTALWATAEPPTGPCVEFRFDRTDWDGVMGERLTHDTIFPVCTPDIAKTLSKPEDLLAHRLFDCDQILGGWDGWLAAQNIALPDDTDINLATTFVITLTAAMADTGVALGHETLTGGLIERGALVRPFEESIPMQQAYYYVQPPRKMTTPATEAFTEWLNGEIQIG